MKQTCRFLYPRAVLALLLTAGSVAGAAAGQIELISRTDPVPDSSGTGFVSALSADGRYVVFQSDAPNLVPGQVDGNGFYDVFLRDRVAGTTLLLSHEAGKPATASPAEGEWDSLDAGLSADGRYAVFVSLGTRLVPGQADANHATDVFLHDRVTGATALVSHASGDPSTTAGGLSTGAAISADGNYIVFWSTAGNLVAGQTAPAGAKKANLFLYQRSSGKLTLISHAGLAPATTANGTSAGAAISANGGYVTFWSTATDLVPGVADTGTASDVFLWERSSGALSLVSHASGSLVTPAAGFSFEPHISGDGRWLAFLSLARNLVAGQTDSPGASGYDIYLFDRISRQTRLASHTSASPQIAAGVSTPDFSGGFSMSADGRHLAFTSTAPNLVAGQTSLSPGSDNVFVYDRVSGGNTLVSHSRDSQTTSPSHPGSRLPRLSADGRYVAFQSVAPDLVPHQTDSPSSYDVFVYDQTSRTTVLASHVRASLTTAGNGPSEFAAISANGGVVAFDSYATDLGEGQADVQGLRDVFLFDRRSAEVTTLTLRDPDLPATTPYGPSSAADISADGRYVLFVSRATGLVPGQVDMPYAPEPFSAAQPGTWDVFLRDRATGKTTLLSRSAVSPPTALGNIGAAPVLSADGQTAAFAEVGLESSSTPRRVYLYDGRTDQLTLVNHQPGSPGQPDGSADQPAISADGRYLVYSCGRCHPDAGGAASSGLFLYDRGTGASTLIDHAAGAPGTEGDGGSSEARLSADGRFAVFLSDATNLVPGQAGPRQPNLFLYDRTTGELTLVSHAAASPATAASAGSGQPEISADGRWIAFDSDATDLVPGQIDTNESTDVFLYDRLSGTTSLVSHAVASPVTASDGSSGSSGEPVSISADGRFVVFVGNAGDLAPGVVNPRKDFAVYLYDRLSGGITLVSHPPGAPATVANNGSTSPRVSADGSRIAYATYATDVAPGQSAASRSTDLIVYDRAAGTSTRVGRTYPASPFGHEIHISLVPRLSADGRWIAFTSDASNLVAGDYNANWDAFLFDAAAGAPVAVPPCALFGGSLSSNARKVLKVAGACGVPAGAKRVAVKITVSQGTGKGNVQLYPGNLRTPAAGILRFERGATRSAAFTLPLSTNGTGTLALLPFVGGNGTVRVSVEIDGYVP